MKKQTTRKKVPLRSSQPKRGSEIEKKVDELLDAHSDVLQKGRGRKEPSKHSLSSKREQALLFLTKSDNKTQPLKQVKNENKPIKKHPQHQQKTYSKTKISQKNPLEKQNIILKINRENDSPPYENILDQKITDITQKNLQPSFYPKHQYFIFRKPLNQKSKNKTNLSKQVEKEKKPTKLTAKEREQNAKRVAKEHDEKVRLERLEVRSKEKEEVLRKKLMEKQARQEVRDREREAKRVAKEHDEKLRLEQIALQKEQREEQKHRDLEKKKAVAEGKEKEQETQNLKKSEKEMKPTTTKTKTHFGFEFYNKKKEGETGVPSVGKKKSTKSAPVQHAQDEFRHHLGKELQRSRLDRQQSQKASPYANQVHLNLVSINEEALPVFEESVAQVKPDESTWLDEKIKSDKTRDVDTKNALETDSDKVLLDDKPLETDLSAISEYESLDATPDLKKTTFDEISPDGKIQFMDVANKLKSIALEHLEYSNNAIEEIDFYSLYEPFAYVEIIREKESLDKRYILIEMGLSEEETRLLNFIKETLEDFLFITEDFDAKGNCKYLNEKVDLIINEYMLNIDPLSKEKIMYYLEKESIGLGRLDVLMKDPNIEDISCDGSDVFIFLYHRRYGSLKSNVMFKSDDELSAFVVKLAQKCGKHISISEPMLDATIPDGSRVQMTLGTEVTTKGSTFTIRKFSQNPFSPPDLIEFHTMSSEMVAYMWLAVENGVNALIAGGTAAGKTSTLNAISLFIPRESKIVSIEETREINLPHPNWIPGVVRSGFGDVVGNKVIGEIDLYDLMKAALRQRPEYILVGEIRGKEAYVLFQAMATGHTKYSTVHADSAESLIHRLEGKPIEIPRIMLQTLDIVCIQVISRVKNKRARRCKQIIEIIDIDPTTKEILTNEVFHWDPIEDKFIYSGKSYILERIRGEKSINREGMVNEIKNRTALLDWMNKNNIRDFKKVATLIARYIDNPADVMKKIWNES
ncbi:Type II/IV secretion system protein [uncultured archaeon]|nr:Type II/IV secretion system protein [uncultured archaeon]